MTYLATYTLHLYFITVIRQSRNICYKGRKDTIVPGGRQFVCYNLAVLSLCLNRVYRKDFFCVARYKFALQIWLRVNQPFYIISAVNRTTRRCLFIVQTWTVPQMIPNMERKWSREKLRNGMGLSLILDEEWGCLQRNLQEKKRTFSSRLLKKKGRRTPDRSLI